MAISAPQCRRCGCEITWRELRDGNGLCFICARNQQDKKAARGENNRNGSLTVSL